MDKDAFHREYGFNKQAAFQWLDWSKPVISVQFLLER